MKLEASSDYQVVLQLRGGIERVTRNRAKSRSLFWHLPSTMFVGIDIAARNICVLRVAYLELDPSARPVNIECERVSLTPHMELCKVCHSRV